MESQLKFADILKSIQPKRDEIASLRKEEESLVSESNKLQELVIDLQKKIQAYQQDYAHLPSTLKKRDEMRLMGGFKDATTGVYTENIVFTHFVKGVKCYSEL